MIPQKLIKLLPVGNFSEVNSRKIFQIRFNFLHESIEGRFLIIQG